MSKAETRTNQKPVLMVVTSEEKMGDTGLPGGFFLAELTHPYLEIKEAGFSIDIASPQGGKAPVERFSDPRDRETSMPNDLISLGFLNSPPDAEKIENTIKLADVSMNDYAGVFFAGGTSALYDFSIDPNVARLVREAWETGKAVGAICHGAAALLNAKLSDGEYFANGMTVTAHDDEEEHHITQTRPQYNPPFLLEDELPKCGAKFVKGKMNESFAVTSGNGRLVTGQNNFSGRETGRQFVSALKHTDENTNENTDESTDESTAKITPKNTMKILAIDRKTDQATPEKVKALLRREAAHAWELIKTGVFREVYQRPNGAGVAVILECLDAAEAERIMSELPLTKAGLNQFDFHVLEAFAGLEILFGEEPRTQNCAPNKTEKVAAQS